MSKHCTNNPVFQSRVAIEAISGRKTIQEIAADHAIHPIQVSQWKEQRLDGASELITGWRKPGTRKRLRSRRLSCSSTSHGCRWSWSD
jgi:hypothetical protein